MVNYLVKYNDGTWDVVTAKSYYIHVPSGRLLFYDELNEVSFIVNSISWKSVARYFEVKEND